MENNLKKDAILQAADVLFTQNGFNGTGVDAIARASGVTKRTLYKQFGSKQGLIEAVLDQHTARMMAAVRVHLEALALPPRERLLACFDYYRTWFAGPNFSGCIFIKTVNEFGNCSLELTKKAQASKLAMRELLREIALEAGIGSAESLADELHLLLEGSIVVAQMGRGPDVIDTARMMAADRVAQADAALNG